MMRRDDRCVATHGKVSPRTGVWERSRRSGGARRRRTAASLGSTVCFLALRVRTSNLVGGEVILNGRPEGSGLPEWRMG